MTADEIKQKANYYSDLYIDDVQKFLKKNKEDASKYSDADRYKIFALAEVYINVKKGVITRQDGICRQRIILG